MLGLELSTFVSYDVPLTLLSLAAGIVSAALAFTWVSGHPVGFRTLLVGGVLVGCGIAAMHYIGMAAMKMDPPIRHDPALFALSIVIAIGASVVAMWCAFTLRMESFFSAFWKKAGSAIIMGSAIFGMHYTGMAAANFERGSISAAARQDFDHTALAVALGAVTLLLLLATLIISAFDAYSQARLLMQTREQLSRDLRRHMTELATSIAHEINQPLAAIGANARAAQGWLGGERPDMNEAGLALRRIGSDAHRAGETIARIRAFLGAGYTCRSAVDMRALVQDVLAQMADKVRRNCHIGARAPERGLAAGRRGRSPTASGRAQPRRQRDRRDERRR
jgi:NO-binding membrane sensor protein with MHYT domain